MPTLFFSAVHLARPPCQCIWPIARTCRVVAFRQDNLVYLLILHWVWALQCLAKIGGRQDTLGSWHANRSGEAGLPEPTFKLISCACRADLALIVSYIALSDKFCNHWLGSWKPPAFGEWTLLGGDTACNQSAVSATGMVATAVYRSLPQFCFRLCRASRCL